MPVTRDSQWIKTVSQLDDLVENHQSDIQSLHPQGITKSHWEIAGSRQNCSNKRCKKEFGYTVWSQNCYRCGQLFCNDCLQYKRALNNLARPDPQGKLYKVCEVCFDKGPQTLGAVRSQTEDFRYFCNRHRDIQNRIIRGSAGRVSRLDLVAECGRLKRGFKEHVGNSSVAKAMREIRCIVKAPDWLRSSFYQEQRFKKMCYNCEKEFGILNSRHLCCVCGVNSCAQCVTSELIVHIPDNNPLNEAQLSIIKIVGCPEVEPELCMYLKVCYICRMHLQKKQVADYHEQEFETCVDDSWTSINDVQKTASSVQRKINVHLPQFQELIESLAQTHHTPMSTSHKRSNIQVLAKSQCDLADHFTRLVMVIHGMKRLVPNSKGQTTILRNMTTGFLGYYNENMYLYRELKNELESVTPAQILDRIQAIVEKNTLNSAYLTIKQLIFESIHIQSKYELSSDFAERILQVERVMVIELREAVKRDGEMEWDEHEKLIDQLIRTRLHENEFFIRLSRRMTKTHGQRYITVFMLERLETVLQRVELEIAAKCAETRFKPTTIELEKLHDYIGVQLSEVMKENENWGLVSLLENDPTPS